MQTQHPEWEWETASSSGRDLSADLSSYRTQSTPPAVQRQQRNEGGDPGKACLDLERGA